MSPHQLEVADVFRTYGPAYLNTHGDRTSLAQKRVIRDIVACRTSVLGGHAEQCDACGHQRIAYNSCRNRHCPKCQSVSRAKWLDARAAELLDVPYFHVVFTFPSVLGPLALQNQRTVYGILFRAAAETLKEIAADPKHLGAEIGFLTVLHTWGQNLMHHPHLHCVVTGGGIAPDRSRWIPCRKSFFLPVRVLSRVFRGKFLHYLRKAMERGLLTLHGRLQALVNRSAFEDLLNEAVEQDWVVYAKRPFGGPQQVLKYLARYTHRVAISNRRLVSAEDGKVRFRWKDYRRNNQEKTMSLDAYEFMRRFLLHVLPSGFMRIRHFGFLANRHRRVNLALCRRLLAEHGDIDETGMVPITADDAVPVEADNFLVPCPVCRQGRMLYVDAAPRDITSRPAVRRPFMLTLRATCTYDTS